MAKKPTINYNKYVAVKGGQGLTEDGVWEQLPEGYQGETYANEQAPVQEPATQQAAPVQQAPAAPVAQQPNSIEEAKQMAPKGTYVNKYGEDFSTSQKVKATNMAAALPEMDKRAADYMKNNSIAQKFAELIKPQEAPEDPAKAIQREKNKKTALLLADTLRTLMGGVAMNNNASIPAIEHDGIATIDDNIKRLSDDYATAVKARRTREDEIAKQAAEYAKADADNILQLQKQLQQGYETDLKNKQNNKIDIGYNQYRYPASSSKDDGSGSKKDTNTVWMKIADVDYNDLTKEEKQDFIDIATKYALDERNKNSEIRKVLQRQYDEAKKENAGGHDANNSDPLGEKTNSGINWDSFDKWVKTSPVAQATIISEIASNYDDLEGFDTALEDRLRATGRYGYDNTWKSKRGKRPIIPGKQNPDETGVTLSGVPFKVGDKWCIKDTKGNTIELVEGVPFIDNKGRTMMLDRGRIVKYENFGNF